MSLITGPITGERAVVGVFVGVSPVRESLLRKHGLRVPPPVGVRLQIDTGSHLTVLLPNIFQALEIQYFDRIEVRTPSTSPGQPHLADQYDVTLHLVSGTDLTPISGVHAIAAADFDDAEGIQGVRGRDVLDRCNFYWHGPEKSFDFAF